MKKDIAIRNKRFLIKQLSNTEDDPFTLYLNSLAPSGRRSMKSQLIGILRLMGYLDDPTCFPWANLKYVHIVKIRNLLLEQGKSANTINTTIAAINGVMRTGFNIGLLSADEYMRIKLIKRVNSHKLPVGRELKRSELKRMLACCKRDNDALGIRDAAIIGLMVSTGLRRSEVASLNIEDYSVKDGSLIVQQGKGNRQRMTFITPHAKKLMLKWMKLRAVATGILFSRVVSCVPTDNKLSGQSIYNIIKARSEQAGIERCSPHDLRRTLVTRLLDTGIDINTVRQIVGHQDVNTTARYDRRNEQINSTVIRKLDIL
ncbi:MAG: site-specific integrase [Gammaproteobacteria bacterium]|nr:site-specific integrase [Gammaproteobacteria bacterium]